MMSRPLHRRQARANSLARQSEAVVVAFDAAIDFGLCNLRSGDFFPSKGFFAHSSFVNTVDEGDAVAVFSHALQQI